MGKPTGFMEVARAENPYRDEAARLRDFDDLHISQPADARHAQASRCMNCGVPFCQSDFGCPLHNLIPEWNDLLYRGREREALERLLQTAPFPEFTGRVCPALCEKACNLENDALTNRDNELYLIETGFEKGWIHPRIPRRRTGRRVAVVGSGPAGLAAADLLNRLGHEVTVIERADRAGGLLMYGIPNMKLPKGVVERRIRLMETEGVRFLLNTEAKPEIMEEYDAVALCGGAKKPRALNVAGIFAVDYLTAATRAVLSGDEPAIDARGRHVVVVGGGDTSNDCVGTALRQGCASVIQLEMMPAPPVERTAGNPWPEWPRTLRTDYGQLEAIHRQGADPRVYETTVKSIQPGAVETVKLKGFDPIPGTERALPCDLLLIAAGFVGCETATAERFNVKLNPRGCMMPESGGHHLRNNLFSAGDMRTGQSLMVRALADGRAAALEIERYLGNLEFVGLTPN
ncbi:MAG: glutamate synthase subunit beta [Clostridia bacterium]|nr:glutamate synthase subunit beta [Clostridia bacterium]